MGNRPPRALAISPPESTLADLGAWLAGLGSRGIDGVQIRRKQSSAREVIDTARRVREATGEGVVLLINGRADIALASAADGVHLPVSGLSATSVRDLLGPSALIGRSTHSLAEVEAALAEGASYVTFGPVYPTPSKEAYGPPAGVDRLAEAARFGIPVLALGGVTTIERVRECAETGAWGVAGIRLFMGAGSTVNDAHEWLGLFGNDDD